MWFKPISLLLIISTFLLLLVGYLRPITAFTQDLGRHILTGEIITKSGQVPKTNLFSYTYPDFPFINHHWLSEVLFYFEHSLLGVVGLQMVSILVIIAAFSLIYFFALKRSSLFAVTAIAIFYLPILLDRTDIRPELFSFLFLSLFSIILFTYKERFTKLIYLLIPLELLWVNTHIYFFVGIVIFALFVIDEFFTKRKNLMQKHTKILIGVFVATVLITLLNPNGLTGALYPLHVFQNYGYTIEENQTIFFLEQLGIGRNAFSFFKIAVVVLFLSLALSYKKTRPIDWLLALVFTYAGIMAVRNFPLFVFATFIPASIALRNSGEALKKYIKIPDWSQLGISLLFLCILFWQIVQVSNAKPLGIGFANGAERAVDFYLKNNLSGPIFNNFDIGSYIEYRMYPKEKVFIDGRPEAYPASFIQTVYIPMQQDPSLFKKASDTYKFNAIFFSHTDMTPWGNAFLSQILKSNEWTPVYLDDTIIILLKNNKKNETLIKKHGMSAQNLQPKHVDTKNLKSLLQLASFYNKTGLLNQEMKTYQQILNLDPDNCPVLYNTALILTNTNDASAPIFAARYQQFCQK